MSRKYTLSKIPHRIVERLKYSKYVCVTFYLQYELIDVHLKFNIRLISFW